MTAESENITYVFEMLRSQAGLVRLEQIESDLGLVFKDKAKLAEALTHSSAAGDFNSSDSAVALGVQLTWNERLEFLGDAVLGLAIVSHLVQREEKFVEGELSKIKSQLVSETELAQIGRKLRLNEYLLLGRSENQTKGREKDSLIADCLEALIGAIYIDQGFLAAASFVIKVFADRLAENLSVLLGWDIKSVLQEYVQDVFKETPSYQLIQESGPAHQRQFEVGVKVKNKIIAKGIGTTKKKASQAAAEAALQSLAKKEVNEQETSKKP